MEQKISLKTFLKTYTAIPNKFINNYYKFYELCLSDTFGINGNDIAIYLGLINVEKFYERVRNIYRLNYDYIIKKFLVKKTYRAEYFFSFDCFEKICMVSRTEKGNMVRDYFITLRKFINYYRENIADNINNLAKSGKYVYILLVNKNKSIFKVGETGNMRKRLYTYLTGKERHPDIYFIMIVKDSKKIEKCVKLVGNNKKYKIGKELYKMDFDSLKAITVECAILHDNFFDNIERNKYDSYIIYDESKNANIVDLDGNIIGYEKGIKKVSKKTTKTINKKTSKKVNRKTSKKKVK